MKFSTEWLVAVAALAIAGCATIRTAREAQEGVAAKGRDAAVSADARPVDFRGYSLQQLVGYAMTNSPAVASARLAVEDARLALRQVAANAPLVSDTPWNAATLSASARYAESSQGAAFGSGGGWRTAGDPSAALSLDLLLWDFGRNDAEARAQSERVLAAEHELIDVGYGVFGSVSQAYFNFMQSKALLAVASTNEQQYAAHLARAEERMKAGESYRLDVLRARLDLANARQATVAASNGVDVAGAALMRALGVDASRGTWESAFGTSPIGIDRVFRGFAGSGFDVGTAFSLARTNAPVMRVARARLRAASHNVDLAVADLYPTVSASASLSWTDPLWFWSWGLSAAQSIFQGFRKTTAVDRAVVAMRQASAAVDEQEQNLSVELETAIATRDNSAVAIRSAMASVKSAKENLDTVQEQLSVGSVSRIELSDAIAADSQARGDCITAFYDNQRAEAAIYAIIGKYPEYREEIVIGENAQ